MSSAGHWHSVWRSLPIGGLDEIIGSGTCVVLAPHPDDESLGCGGLIAASVAVGRAPLVVILTDGAGSHAGSRAYPPERLRAVRAGEAQAAVATLGLAQDRLVFLREPDTAAPYDGPAFDAVVAKLVRLVRRETHCSAILAPWRHDPHCDHEAASLIAAAVASAVGIRHVAYPVWGWMMPPDKAVAGSPGSGWRLSVETFLPRKRAAIFAHETQYGGLITDDPAGFELPKDLLAVFEGPYETYLRA
jgi:LmbE family N-acetylglucosaminyl deacetylase